MYRKVERRRATNWSCNLLVSVLYMTYTMSFLLGCDTAYMYGEVPFMDVCYDPLQHLSWWQARAMDNNANVLLVCHFVFLTFLQIYSTLLRFLELNSFQFCHPRCVMSVVPPSCQLSTWQSAMVSAPKIWFTWLNFTITGHMVLNLPCTLTPLLFTCQNPKLHPKLSISPLQCCRTF